MQEIALILSSLAGVATAAAVRKMPRDKSNCLALVPAHTLKVKLIL